MNKSYTKAFWFFLGDAGVRVLGFITTILLARTLGTEAYGLITIAVAILGFASWFSDLGLNSLGTRTLSLPKKKRSYKTFEIFRIRIILGLFMLFIFSTFIWGTHFQSPSTGLVIQLFLLSLIPQSISLEWYFNGKQNYRWITISRLAQAAAYLLFIYLFITESGLLIVPILYFLSALLSISILFAVMPVRKKLKGYWPSYPKVREMIISALPLGLGSLFSQVVIFMPPLVIGFYFGFHEAGIFGVAFKIILLFFLIDRFLIRLLLPELTNLWDENRTRLKKDLQRSIHWMLFSGTFFALLLNTGSDFFINMLFGEKYNESAILLNILTLFLPLVFVNSIFSYGIISSGYDTAYLRGGITGGIAAFFIILLITSVGSLTWVAWSVIIAELFVLISFYTEVRKLVDIDILVPMIRIISIAGLLLLLPYYGLIYYPLSFLLLPLLYIILIFMTRSMTVNDLLWIKMKLFKERT